MRSAVILTFLALTCLSSVMGQEIAFEDQEEPYFNRQINLLARTNPTFLEMLRHHIDTALKIFGRSARLVKKSLEPLKSDMGCKNFLHTLIGQSHRSRKTSFQLTSDQSCRYESAMFIRQMREHWGSFIK